MTQPDNIPADILIVDDTPANLQVLAGMLKDRGHKVRPAPNGKLALAAAQKDPPDLILLDINMPDMNGYQVCEQLKADEWLRDIPVIFISALAEPLDKVRAFALGGLDYITKPFQIEELHSRVDTHLKIRRLQIQVEEAHARNEKTNIRTMSDLKAAAKIQKTFLPASTPEIPGLKLAWACKPSDELGGYGLNIIPLGAGRTAVYILDISGQGVSAVLLSITLSRLLSPPTDPASILFQGKDALGRPDLTAPADVAEQLNQLLRADKDSTQFAALLYGIIDLPAATFRYISGGNPGPIHVPAAPPPIHLKTPGAPIGLAEEPYTTHRIKLSPGDRLYLYSDGIPDAPNPQQDQFSQPRLLHALTQRKPYPLADGLISLLTEITRWQDTARASSDISIIALEIESPAAA